MSLSRRSLLASTGLAALHRLPLVAPPDDGNEGHRPSHKRDAFKQPYPPESYWNMPIGSGAKTVPLGFYYGGDGPFKNGRIAVAEDNVLCLDPDAPKAYIMETDAGWKPNVTRCGSRTGRILTGNGSVSPMPKLPIPTDFVTIPYIGSRPNMSGALLYRDGLDVKIFETQPFHICADGVAVSQSVNSWYVGDSIYTGGMGLKGGSHGGSRLSALGGTIRLGELVPGGVIPHVLKFSLDTSWYCSTAGGFGYVWPAIRADSYWESYGINNPAVPPQAKMGMLLTIPETFPVDALISEPARILARAVRDYGSYLVDGDNSATVPWYTAWHVEMSNEGFFVNEFRETWGYEFFHRPSLHGTPSPAQMQFRADVGRIMTALQIVTNNSSVSPGGPGLTRRAPLAPPF